MPRHLRPPPVPIAALLPSLLPLLLLAACHPPAIDAPSLGLRPVERQPVALPDAASEADAPTDPTLAARLTALIERADAGDRAFEAERAAAADAVGAARGAAPGSDPWVRAQARVSALDAAQAPARDANAAIEALRGEPANFGPGARAAIDAAAAHVGAVADREARAAAELGRDRP